MPFWTASCRTQRQLTNADDKHNFHWLYLLHNMTWNNEGSGILWFSPYIYMIIWQRFFFDLGIMQSVSPLCPDSLAPNFKMTSCSFTLHIFWILALCKISLLVEGEHGLNGPMVNTVMLPANPFLPSSSAPLRLSFLERGGPKILRGKITFIVPSRPEKEKHSFKVPWYRKYSLHGLRISLSESFIIVNTTWLIVSLGH